MKRVSRRPVEPCGGVTRRLDFLRIIKKACSVFMWCRLCYVEGTSLGVSFALAVRSSSFYLRSSWTNLGKFLSLSLKRVICEGCCLEEQA